MWFAWEEDKLASSLILYKKAFDSKVPPATENVVSSMIDINLDKLFTDFNTFK